MGSSSCTESTKCLLCDCSPCLRWLQLSQQDWQSLSYIQGQPQCLKKVISVVFESAAGRSSLSEEGALLPIAGTSAVGRCLGDHQEASSC